MAVYTFDDFAYCISEMQAIRETDMEKLQNSISSLHVKGACAQSILSIPSLIISPLPGGTDLLVALNASAAPLRALAQSGKLEGDVERRIFLLTDMLVTANDMVLLECAHNSKVAFYLSQSFPLVY